MNQQTRRQFFKTLAATAAAAVVAPAVAVAKSEEASPQPRLYAAFYSQAKNKTYHVVPFYPNNGIEARFHVDGDWGTMTEYYVSPNSKPTKGNAWFIGQVVCPHSLRDGDTLTVTLNTI